MRIKSVLAAAGLATSVCGVALGQAPTVDGTRDASYGAPLYVNSQNPTQFGDNNYVPGGACNPTSGAGVTTGIELRIPLAAIGSPATSAIKIAAMINSGSHDYLSNQVIGGIPVQPNLADPRNVDFQSLSLGGNQYIVPVDAAAAPVIDGTLDAAYGAAQWTQNQGTGFGDASTTTTATANGSELDGAYAVVNGGFLYLFLTGNLESNFNKLEIFIDSKTGGQNRLRGDNPNVDFDGLNRMGASNPNNGLRFDAGFDADYWIGVTNGGGTPAIYVNASELLDTGGGVGAYAGTTTHAGNGLLSGGTNNLNIEATINNLNTAGVDGCVPPASSTDAANGSEIDAVYAYRDGTDLYLFVSGNLESNFNVLNLFFDVKSGGQNQLRGDNVSIDFDALTRMGQRSVTAPIDPMDPLCQVADPCNNGCPCATTNYPGLKFDAGFEADYWFAFKSNGHPVVQYANTAVLRTGGRALDILFNSLDYGSYYYVAKGLVPVLDFPSTFYDVQQDPFVTPQLTLINLFSDCAPGILSGDPAVDNPPHCYNPAAYAAPGRILATINNSNLAGVTGTTSDQASSAAVATGFEFKISLAELGATPSSVIKVAGFVAGSDYTFMSNQVFGGLPPAAGNPGDTSSVDFSNETTFPGNQFVTINPPVVGPDCFTRGPVAGAPSCSPAYTASARTRPTNAGHYAVGGANGTTDTAECISDWDGNGCVLPSDVAAFVTSAFYDFQNGTTDAQITCGGGPTVPATVASFVTRWFTALSNPAGDGCN